MVEEREPKMLRAFTAMQVDASGQLKTGQIQSERTAHPLPGRNLIQSTSVPESVDYIHVQCSSCGSCDYTYLPKFLSLPAAAEGTLDLQARTLCSALMRICFGLFTGTLSRLGVSATEENAKAMIRCAPPERRTEQRPPRRPSTVHSCCRNEDPTVKINCDIANTVVPGAPMMFGLLI